MSEDGERWLSIGDAARALGVGRAAIYGRIKRSTLPARRGNDGAWRVMVADAVAEASRAAAADRHGDINHDDRTMAALTVELARTEAELAAVTRELEGTAGRLAKVEADLAETRAELLAELRRSIWSRIFGRR